MKHVDIYIERMWDILDAKENELNRDQPKSHSRLQQNTPTKYHLIQLQDDLTLGSNQESWPGEQLAEANPPQPRQKKTPRPQ